MFYSKPWSSWFGESQLYLGCAAEYKYPSNIIIKEFAVWHRTLSSDEQLLIFHGSDQPEEATTDAPTTQFSRGSTNYTCNSSNVATGTTPISVSLEDLLNKELGNISLEEGKEILEQAQSILDGENQVNQASHLVSLVDIYITVGNVDELQNATLEDSLSFVQTGISLANSLLRDKYTSFFKETSCSKPCNDSTSSPAGKIANTTEHLMLSLADKILERDGESFSSSSDNIGLYNSRFIVIPLIFMLVSHLICIGSLAV
ncbi:uncharacterized protein LOC110984460 isoform X2 [Acanthaster planci]|uniref:Uncharacterized protein LOC110984460 isoform X2 n=1 Tax=Acanthaster planci TaxID=133434 RepID=A0A8B7Z404_ACAPL|nr:uncharacterized protein LOC110984460 isoform X2 [Acanthaster planci]